MAIDAQQAAIRAVVAGALAEHVSESGQSVDALVAMRQAEAIVKALERAGYEIKPNLSSGYGQFPQPSLSDLFAPSGA
jgi:hypothetical protein